MAGTRYHGLYRGLQSTAIFTDTIPSLPTGTLVSVTSYPNPFNGSTVITYDLLNASRVRLEVYDILGRRVKRLVDYSQAPGRHRLSFESAALTNGVYFYTLQTEGFSETKMMVMAK